MYIIKYIINVDARSWEIKDLYQRLYYVSWQIDSLVTLENVN